MWRFVEKLSVAIVNNYFLLFAINGFLAMIGMKYIAKLDLLIMLAASMLTISYLMKRITYLDLFIIVFIGLIAIYSYTRNYDFSLWYLGCRTELYFTIFFFVGKHPAMQNKDILKKGLLPFIITCIIGLILYFFPQPWYIDYKMSIWSDQDDIGRFLEMSRLSAFWPYPYWVSYGCCIMYIYILSSSYRIGHITKKNISIMSFIVLIVLLTQQRAPLIMIASVTILYCIIILLFQPQKSKWRMWNSIILLFVLLSSIVVFAYNIMGEDMRDRMFDKLEAFSEVTNFVEDRTANMNRDFRTKEVTFFGDGIGRYSHAAYFQGKSAITDQQYLKMLYEIGIIGCIGYAFILLTTIIRGLKNVQKNQFELLIIIFFLMAMTGANCLAVFEQHVAIFWLSCGLIFTKYKNLNTN